MKAVSALLILSILLMGCNSSYVVSSSPTAGSSFAAFNAFAEGRSGAMQFQDGSALEVKNVIAAPDSTVFVSGAAGAITVVPTRAVKKVVFNNRLIGSLEGFGFGALGGGSIILFVAGIRPLNGEFSGPWYLMFFVLLGAGAGGLIGAVPGVLTGHTTEYQFVPGPKGAMIH